MHHAGAGLAVGAIANEQVTAGHAFQHEGEVFAARQHGAMGVHAVVAKMAACHVDGALGFARVVDQHRITPAPIHFGAHVETLGLGLYQRLEAAFGRLAHLRVQRPHADFQLRGVGNHVVRMAGVECAHGDDHGLHRVGVARDDGL